MGKKKQHRAGETNNKRKVVAPLKNDPGSKKFNTHNDSTLPETGEEHPEYGLLQQQQREFGDRIHK